MQSYRDTLRLLLIFASERHGKAPGKLDIDDLDAPLIGAFLDHLEHERQNGVRTRNARLAAIRSLFRYPVRRLRPRGWRGPAAAGSYQGGSGHQGDRQSCRQGDGRRGRCRCAGGHRHRLRGAGPRSPRHEGRPQGPRRHQAGSADRPAEAARGRQYRGDHGSGELAGALCRFPDYADVGSEPVVFGGNRCEGVGIIRGLRGRRGVCRSVGSGRVWS
ncbi:phage integrase family protein [Paramagnetospirillum caucaseum]|uniref:Phage integrase family protein n=1 Tax=Paramagnetospirillum caucaseum TaxID=1244869 RepID=M2Y8Q5_9PROT|nr:phage integrase family protein [Paramagnetospirillum caucaseum]